MRSCLVVPAVVVVVVFRGKISAMIENDRCSCVSVFVCEQL